MAERHSYRHLYSLVRAFGPPSPICEKVAAQAFDIEYLYAQNRFSPLGSMLEPLQIPSLHLLQ
jgi:hypothetical protein